VGGAVGGGGCDCGGWQGVAARCGGAAGAAAG